METKSTNEEGMDTASDLIRETFATVQRGRKLVEDMLSNSPPQTGVTDINTGPSKKETIARLVASLGSVNTEIRILHVSHPNYAQDLKLLAKWQNLQRRSAQIKLQIAEAHSLPDDPDPKKGLEGAKENYRQKLAFYSRFVNAAKLLLPPEDYATILELAESD